MTYTCIICGDSYTEEIPVLTTHSYVEGACTVCGEGDPDYVAPTDPTEPSEPTEPEAPAKENFFTMLINAIIAFFKWLFGIK